jgi:hypothetical protein
MTPQNVHSHGWAGIKNGELLRRANGVCEVEFRQNIKILPFGIVVVRSRSNRIVDHVIYTQHSFGGEPGRSRPGHDGRCQITGACRPIPGAAGMWSVGMLFARQDNSIILFPGEPPSSIVETTDGYRWTPCEQLGTYLFTKRVAQSGHIHIAVDRASKYELVAATLKSLEGTGIKVGFVDYDAHPSP